MTTLLISLDEVDRVKRINGIRSTTDLAKRTGLSRNTWTTALKTRIPREGVLQELHNLGGRPDRLLVAVEPVVETEAA